ncbi:unnamed protein product [Prunus armeniaca]
MPANSSDAVVPTDAPVKDNSSASEPIKADANGVSAVEESTEGKPEAKESETENSTSQPKQVYNACVEIRVVMVSLFFWEKRIACSALDIRYVQTRYYPDTWN